jgi:hypothetical protein
MSDSVQMMVRPGEPLDLYYYSGETSKKQAFPVTQNTKYQQQLNNLRGGTSTFLFPPQCGLQDVVVTMTFPAISTEAGSTDNLALPAGWAYAAIKSASWRYAGTSQFLLDGQQLLQNALRDQSSKASCDDLVNIGGFYASGDDFLFPQTASVVLRLPHCSASGVNKSLPFPTDALTQQVQILLELQNVADIFTNSTPSVALPAACSQFDSAFFQVQQIMFNNMGDALARRVDLSSKAYAFPCEFVQQKVAINNLQYNANGLNQPANSVVLSGFRAGQVKNIQIWCTNNDDTIVSPSARNGGVYQPQKWYAPVSVEMLYAGDIYARYNNGVGKLFNLLNSNKSNSFNTVSASVNAGVVVNPPQAFLSSWLELPFAQPMCDEDSHFILVHGKAITNGIINLNNLILPPVPSVNGWTLNISYVYNCTILFSQGSCDYVF